MDNDLDETTNSNVPNNDGIEWTAEHEQILVEWADKAMCYRWLHSKSNAMFSSLAIACAWISGRPSRE